MDQIYAVVLSYKRKELLKRCLHAINDQTRRYAGIIVVDNASHDGTEEMLQQLQQQLPSLKVYVLSQNTGASGGFSAGFRMAYQQGADHVWMMDDDVIPEPDALEQLVDAGSRLDAKGKPYSFLLSRAYTEDGLLTNVPSVDQRMNEVDYENWPDLLDLGVIPVRPATYVSILVPRASLQRYGLPLAPMFMWGDDTEYTLRLSQDIPGYLVAGSKVWHLRKVSGSINIQRETDPGRTALHRHFIRNEQYIARQYHSRRRVVTVFLSRLMLAARMLKGGQVEKSRIIFKGLLESFSFNPVAEPADAPVEALGVSVRELVALPSTQDPVAESGAEVPSETYSSTLASSTDAVESTHPQSTGPNRRVLVCGAGGQVGHCIVNQAASFGLEAIGLTRQMLDITSERQIREAIERYQPALIINAAAYTNLDQAEAEVAKAEAVNRDGAAKLAAAARQASIPLFHLSSEYVFSGDGTEPYRETDQPRPASVYGATRRAGEQAICQTLDRHLILRTSWIYAEQGNNFVRTMLNVGSKSDEVSVVSDQIGCPTRARSIARVFIELALRYCRDGDLQWGLYHYSGASACSWAEFAEQIFREAEQAGLIEKAPRVVPVPSESLPRAASRPAWSVLDCSLIETTFGIRPKPWQDELRHVICRISDAPAVASGPAPSRVPYKAFPFSVGDEERTRINLPQAVSHT
jgi:dTDP-4-dehydrorhamnose reductase